MKNTLQLMLFFGLFLTSETIAQSRITNKPTPPKKLTIDKKTDLYFQELIDFCFQALQDPNNLSMTNPSINAYERLEQKELIDHSMLIETLKEILTSIINNEKFEESLNEKNTKSISTITELTNKLCQIVDILEIALDDTFTVINEHTEALCDKF